MICRECKVEKPRFWSGQTHNRGHKIYWDGSHKRWNGHQCPDCKNAPKTLVKKDGGGLVGPVLDTNPTTHRLCRRCKECLPASCYFWHKSCHPYYNPQNDVVYTAEDWGCGIALNLANKRGTGPNV